jgi:hypothetical protein
VDHMYGFHANRTGNDVLDAIKRIRPRVIKALDHNVGFWSEVRTLLPDAFLIGRLAVPQQHQVRFADNPTGVGRAFAEHILRLEANQATVNGRRLFDAWESFNEVLPGHASPHLKQAYDDFQVAFAGPIKEAGMEPIAMNFGTGNMLGDDFLNHFAGTLETYTYLGFHEYDWPDMWWLHCTNIAEKDEGGMWLTLRYRRIMDEVRQVHGDRHTAIVTECGMTQGVVGGEDVGPWHPPTIPAHKLEELNSKPRRYPGCPEGVPPDPVEELEPGQGISEDRYWQSLLWYNHEIMKDDYLMAALLFVVGAIHPWESFEHLGGIIDRLEAYQEAEPEKPEPEPPLEVKLLVAAEEAQVIQFNPNAALQKQIFAADFVPNSPEFEVESEGIVYVAQRAEHLATGEVRVYYARKGEWAAVDYVTRPERDANLIA